MRSGRLDDSLEHALTMLREIEHNVHEDRLHDLSYLRDGPGWTSAESGRLQSIHLREERKQTRTYLLRVTSSRSYELVKLCSLFCARQPRQ